MSRAYLEIEHDKYLLHTCVLALEVNVDIHPWGFQTGIGIWDAVMMRAKDPVTERRDVTAVSDGLHALYIRTYLEVHIFPTAQR